MTITDFILIGFIGLLVLGQTIYSYLAQKKIKDLEMILKGYDNRLKFYLDQEHKKLRILENEIKNIKEQIHHITGA